MATQPRITRPETINFVRESITVQLVSNLNSVANNNILLFDRIQFNQTERFP